MTIASTTIEELTEQVRGDVVAPGDETYDEARTVYNAMIDKKPACIVQCTGVADVILAVDVARESGTPVAVRGGAHSVPGFGTADDALVVDLTWMRGIRVDPDDQRVRAEGGCTWNDVNHATYPFGLAVPGGVVGSTGIGGLTLGGGIGYLSRKHGLSLDNLVSADMVLADGSFVTVSEDEHEDLFWAIRGGGGNFGVVTSFEYEAHPVEDIVGGPVFFSVDDAEQVLRFYREFIRDAPEELGAFFGFHEYPPADFVPDELVGEKNCGIFTCWTGPPEEADEVLAPIRKAAEPELDLVEKVPFPEINQLFDPLLPEGLQHYWKTAFVKEVTDEAIEAHLEYGTEIPAYQAAGHLYPIHGACHRVDPDATAWGHRDVDFAFVIAGIWEDPADNEANIRWVRDYHEAISTHSEDRGYVNFTSADDQDEAPANYGECYDRLREVKTEYDPDNLFQFNQNIEPQA